MKTVRTKGTHSRVQATTPKYTSDAHRDISQGYAGVADPMRTDRALILLGSGDMMGKYATVSSTGKKASWFRAGDELHNNA